MKAKDGIIGRALARAAPVYGDAETGLAQSHEWTVLLRGSSSCSVHYGEEAEMRRLASIASSLFLNVVDGPRPRENSHRRVGDAV